MIVIPKKISKKPDPRSNRILHYEYESSSKYVVLYRCVENGTLESFNKKDFLEHKGWQFEKERKPYKTLSKGRWSLNG